MKAEEEAVDVDGVDEDLDALRHQPNGVMMHDESDEDALWAAEEPDDDFDGWQMKLLMQDDDM